MRRRYVQVQGELVEITSDDSPVLRGGGASGDAALWNDRLYQDAGDVRFRTRSEHRDFMRRHGLTTVDDYREAWRAQEKERVAFRQTGKDPTRKADMIEAVKQLMNKR